MRVIAIDGPAGSGKSTVARRVARRLGLDYLDTGAMYRSVALAVLERGVDPHDGEQAAKVAADVTVDVGERVLLDGTDVTAAIREPAVNAVVSTVAAHPGVRVEMVRRQREWVDARGGGVVEGRDIGTVVFTDATLKVFLTASEEARAGRRAEEADVARRDRLDSTRQASPLRPADDAWVIDTTHRTADEVVDEIVARLS